MLGLRHDEVLPLLTLRHRLLRLCRVLWRLQILRHTSWLRHVALHLLVLLILHACLLCWRLQVQVCFLCQLVVRRLGLHNLFHCWQRLFDPLQLLRQKLLGYRQVGLRLLVLDQGGKGFGRSSPATATGSSTGSRRPQGNEGAEASFCQDPGQGQVVHGVTTDVSTKQLLLQHGPDGTRSCRTLTPNRQLQLTWQLLTSMTVATAHTQA